MRKFKRWLGKRFKKHPPELTRLFMVEMWERFSFYLMLGLFLLYMIDTDRGGLGLPYDFAATEIFGSYIAMVYLMPFIGGMLADRLLGYRRAIVLGATSMMFGHIALAVPQINFFYLGLALLVIGNGFFKPNISILLGRLYPDDSPHKKEGYLIFYVGINVGAFICTIIAAFLRNKWGWHAAFGSAAVGMFISLLIFFSIYKKLERGELKKEELLKKTVEGAGLKTLFVTLGAMVVCYFVGLSYWGGTAAFFLALAPAVGFFFWLWHKASPEEKGPISALLAVSVVLIPFWMNFNLYGTTLTKIAEEDTRRHVSTKQVKLMEQAEWLQDAMPSYFFNAAPDVPRPEPEWLQIIAKDSENDEEYAKRIKSEKDAYAKRAIAKGYAEAGAVPVTPAEFEAVYDKAGQAERLKPETPLKLVNPELFQSINPGLVILLMFPIAWIWNSRRKRGHDATIPTMMGTGMLLAAASMLIMLLCVYVGDDFTFKVSPLWLFVAYFVMTAGELCLSPIGLALVSNVAPKRLGAVMMGCFFLSIAVGNKLSGIAGGLWKSVPNNYYFAVLAIVAVVFGIIILALRSWLNRYIPEKE